MFYFSITFRLILEKPGNDEAALIAKAAVRKEKREEKKAKLLNDLEMNDFYIKCINNLSKNK